MKPFLIKFYIDNKDLLTLPMAQNESGVYYMYPDGTYYKPVLSKFDTAVLPPSVKRYTDGSHSAQSQRKQDPIDISYKAGGVITCNLPCKITFKTPSQGSYCEILVKGIKVLLVHTDKWSTSSEIPAMSGICQIRDMAGSHLHLGSYDVKIRDFLLYRENDLVLENIKLKEENAVLTKQISDIQRIVCPCEK